MFFKPVARRIGSSLSNPQTIARIGAVSRGVERVATGANRLSGGLLGAGVRALPFGSLALKAGKAGLEHAEDIASVAGKVATRLGK